MIVRRGEVYLTALPKETKARPVVIVTADWLSRYALDVMVVPVTSVPRQRFPTRVQLEVGEAGLRKKSWAKCDQVTTIPKDALSARSLGRLESAKMLAIEEAVRLSLSL